MFSPSHPSPLAPPNERDRIINFCTCHCNDDSKWKTKPPSDNGPGFKFFKLTKSDVKAHNGHIEQITNSTFTYINVWNEQKLIYSWISYWICVCIEWIVFQPQRPEMDFYDWIRSLCQIRNGFWLNHVLTQYPKIDTIRLTCSKQLTDATSSKQWVTTILRYPKKKIQFE